jgi:hypothetical protein
MKCQRLCSPSSLTNKDSRVYLHGNPFHFRKIDESVCKVAIFHVIDGNIKLFAPNEDDHLPQFYLRDVEGTTILWEETNLLESWAPKVWNLLLVNPTHVICSCFMPRMRWLDDDFKDYIDKLMSLTDCYVKMADCKYELMDKCVGL